MSAVSLGDLDAAVVEILRKSPENRKHRWARRWTFGIDRTLEYARKCQAFDHPCGLLAAAAVSLLEAQALPDTDWNRDMKIAEADRLIAIALREA